MKAALLIIFSVVIFAVLFAGAGAAFFLRLWVDFAISVPARTSAPLERFIPALQWAVPFALYGGILFAMNYAFRRKVHGFVTFLFVSAVFCGMAFGASLLTGSLAAINAPPVALRGAGRTLGHKGLMLNTADTVIVLLGETSDVKGSRVVSIPGQPLIYQADPVDAAGEVIRLPPAPFPSARNAIFDSIRLDFALSARHLSERFRAGFVPFIVWAGALVLLQVAISFIFNIGIWPLANLFFGALILRGILAFEVFINSAETQVVLQDFARGYLPDWYISPFIFGVLAALILIYVILLRIAKGGRHG